MPCKKEKPENDRTLFMSERQLCNLSVMSSFVRVFCTAGRVDFSNIMQFDTIGADKTSQFFYVYMKPRSAVIKY